jgi:hypothetical protein
MLVHSLDLFHPNREILVVQEHLAQTNEGADDLNVHLNRALAPQN